MAAVKRRRRLNRLCSRSRVSCFSQRRVFASRLRGIERVRISRLRSPEAHLNTAATHPRMRIERPAELLSNPVIAIRLGFWEIVPGRAATTPPSGDRWSWFQRASRVRRERNPICARNVLTRGENKSGRLVIYTRRVRAKRTRVLEQGHGQRALEIRFRKIRSALAWNAARQERESALKENSRENEIILANERRFPLSRRAPIFG